MNIRRSISILMINMHANIENERSTYRSLKDEMFPISFGMLPVNSFHMKSLNKDKEEKVLDISKSITSCVFSLIVYYDSQYPEMRQLAKLRC